MRLGSHRDWVSGIPFARSIAQLIFNLYLLNVVQLASIHMLDYLAGPLFLVRVMVSSHITCLLYGQFQGAFDLNSFKGPILPWLRSIDSFNTHDESVRLFIAGGVTSAQVLPGSANAIGMNCLYFKLTQISSLIHRWSIIHDKAASDGGALSFIYDN